MTKCLERSFLSAHSQNVALATGNFLQTDALHGCAAGVHVRFAEAVTSLSATAYGMS